MRTLAGKKKKNNSLRAIAVNGSVLYSGGSDGKVRSWDLSSNPPSTKLLQDQHAAAVRAIDSDPCSHVVFSAANDRTIKVWSPDGSS